MNLIYETLWAGAGSGSLISMLEKLSLYCSTVLTTLVLFPWKWMYLFLRNNYLLRCCGCLSFLNWGFLHYLIKLLPKIRAVILSIRFLSPESVLYLYVSTIWPYSCHTWAGAPNCYTWKCYIKLRICRTINSPLAASVKPLDHCRNVVSLVFSTGITLVDVKLSHSQTLQVSANKNPFFHL